MYFIKTYGKKATVNNVTYISWYSTVAIPLEQIALSLRNRVFFTKQHTIIQQFLSHDKIKST